MEHHTHFRDESVAKATAWTLADGDVQVTPNDGSAVDAKVRGRSFIARNVPLDPKADNSIVASTSATTLADYSPSSDTVLDIGDPARCLGECVPPSPAATLLAPPPCCRP